MSDLGNSLLVALGIGMLIFIHELGHYLAARWIGARVEVFSLGFGPRIWGFRRGPTDYRLSLIPLGGYVAVAGQDPGDQRFGADHSLHEKSVSQRALFFSGGVVMNVLFALVAFPIAFRAGVSFQAPEIGRIDFGSGAWEARLESGDRVLAINGKQVYSFDTLQNEVALAGGRNVHLRIDRNGVERTIEVRPQFQPDYGFYVIGVDSAIAAEAPTIQVKPDGAAAELGLRSGDQLLQLDGHSTMGQGALEALLPKGELPGAVRTLTVRRDGVESTVTISPRPDTSSNPPQIGVLPFARVVSGLRTGLPVLAALDLQHGDVLLAIDGAPFRSATLAVADSTAPVLDLLVRRGDRELHLRAPIEASARAELADHLALAPDFADTVVLPAEDGAAIAAGLQAADRIVRIDGKAVTNWTNLRARIQDAKDARVQLDIERPAPSPGAAPIALSMSVQPRLRTFDDYGYTALVAPKRTEVRAAGFVDALRLGSVCAVDLVKQLYVTLKRLLTGDVAAKNLGGIIQISRQSYHYTQWGMPRFLYFLALLSINLAFINVLPIPVLDGGHLLFLLIEKIKGSPVSVRVLNYSQVFGLVLVLALVVFVTYNDILRLL